MKRIFSIILVALMLAGCSTQRLDKPSPAVARIVLTESGGIAGMLNVLTIEPNLAVTYQTRQSASSSRLTAQQMTALVDAFYSNDFFALKDEYRPPTVVADGVTTSIAYNDAKRSKTVVTSTGADEPEALQRVIDAVKAVSVPPTR